MEHFISCHTNDFLKHIYTFLENSHLWMLASNFSCAEIIVWSPNDIIYWCKIREFGCTKLSFCEHCGALVDYWQKLKRTQPCNGVFCLIVTVFDRFDFLVFTFEVSHFLLAPFSFWKRWTSWIMVASLS